MIKIILKQGTVMFRPDFKDFIIIATVETHKREPGKKLLTKLKEPIFHIEYLLNYKPSFTTYEKEIINMLSFDRWIFTHEIKN